MQYTVRHIWVWHAMMMMMMTTMKAHRREYFPCIRVLIPLIQTYALRGKCIFGAQFILITLHAMREEGKRWRATTVPYPSIPCKTILRQWWCLRSNSSHESHKTNRIIWHTLECIVFEGNPLLLEILKLDMSYLFIPSCRSVRKHPTGNRHMTWWDDEAAVHKSLHRDIILEET